MNHLKLWLLNDLPVEITRAAIGICIVLGIFSFVVGSWKAVAFAVCGVAIGVGILCFDAYITSRKERHEGND
jgi:hypothetical protein